MIGRLPRPDACHHSDMNFPAVRIIGVFLFAATGLLYLTSGLVAPLWGIAVLWVIWIGFLVFLIRSWKGSPVVVLMIPFVAAAVWLLVIWIGDIVFGWTA